MFHLRYGPANKLGWGSRLRRDFAYYTPDDYYEALVAGTVAPGMNWLDAGCGRELFPSNRGLARSLSQRCNRLVGVDPDPTLQENAWVHEKNAGILDDYDGKGQFDLVTLRMVAEHVADPERCVQSIHRALRPGGIAVIYTVFAGSPMPLLTRLAPMSLRRRSSIGSMPSATAALSSWISIAKRGCTEPCPRLGPHAGLLVYARRLAKR